MPVVPIVIGIVVIGAIVWLLETLFPGYRDPGSDSLGVALRKLITGK